MRLLWKWSFWTQSMQLNLIFESLWNYNVPGLNLCMLTDDWNIAGWLLLYESGRRFVKLSEWRSKALLDRKKLCNSVPQSKLTTARYASNTYGSFLLLDRLNLWQHYTDFAFHHAKTEHCTAIRAIMELFIWQDGCNKHQTVIFIHINVYCLMLFHIIPAQNSRSGHTPSTSAQCYNSKWFNPEALISKADMDHAAKVFTMVCLTKFPTAWQQAKESSCNCNICSLVAFPSRWDRIAPPCKLHTSPCCWPSNVKAFVITAPAAC